MDWEQSAREAGILENSPDGYLLTPQGKALLEDLVPLRDWAERWHRRQ